MKDDCWLRHSVCFTNPTTHLEAVDIWHVNVENDGIKLANDGLPDGTLAIMSAGDDVTKMLQCLLQSVTLGIVIIHHQHGNHGFAPF